MYILRRLHGTLCVWGGFAVSGGVGALGVTGWEWVALRAGLSMCGSKGWLCLHAWEAVFAHRCLWVRGQRLESRNSTQRSIWRRRDSGWWWWEAADGLFLFPRVLPVGPFSWLPALGVSRPAHRLQ